MTDLSASRSATHRDATIDLRDRPPGPPPVPGDLDASERSDGHVASRDDLPAWIPPDEAASPHDGPSRARTAVLAVLVGVLVLALLEVFLLPASYRVRQQHRADEYRDPQIGLVPGEAAFVVQAPTIGLNQVVVRGASPASLRGGPGWRAGSAPPGQGNTVILGHATRWGYPFGRLGDLVAGAPIYLRTRDGRVYTYKVVRVRTVADGDTAVMDPTGPPRITLVTSAAGPLDGRRRVVQATADGRQPEVPGKARERVRAVRDPGRYDERGAGGLLLVLSGALVVGIGALGFVELRRRYRMATVTVVAGPAVALGVLLVLMNLDAFLPVTY